MPTLWDCREGPHQRESLGLLGVGLDAGFDRLGLGRGGLGVWGRRDEEDRPALRTANALSAGHVGHMENRATRQSGAKNRNRHKITQTQGSRAARRSPSGSTWLVIHRSTQRAGSIPRKECTIRKRQRSGGFPPPSRLRGKERGATLDYVFGDDFFTGPGVFR